jgi:hypothetical protein
VAKHVDGQTGQAWRTVTPPEVRGYLAAHRGIRAGYEEARAGRPLDPDAFAGDHGQVIRYEEGRRMFAMMIAREMSAPEWAEDQRPPPLLISVLTELLRSGRSAL